MTDSGPRPSLAQSHPLDGDALTPSSDTLLGAIPIWLVITPLVGVINGALFYLVVGRRPRSLALYVVLATLAASLVQASGLIAPGDPPASLGDVHLISASLAVWATLAITRALKL